MGSQQYRARWIVPVDGRPLEGGTLVIQDGRIISVWEHPRGDAIDLGDVAVIPGLVNPHTHLEFSALTEPLSP
ncbi:MAG TPA: hypothetical protein VFG20_23505, partial [Planctomycetaceae bacterium]|nr:hypothetical protein [Planctomycetaceae bacterium]